MCRSIYVLCTFTCEGAPGDADPCLPAATSGGRGRGRDRGEYRGGEPAGEPGRDRRGGPGRDRGGGRLRTRAPRPRPDARSGLRRPLRVRGPRPRTADLSADRAARAGARVRGAGLPTGLAALAGGGGRPGSGGLGAGGGVRVRDVPLAPAASSAPDPEPPPAALDDRRLLSVLLSLPPAYRRTLLLYDGVGLGLPETAAETEASTPAAAGRLLHAREVVAARVPELADPEELRLG